MIILGIIGIIFGIVLLIWLAYKGINVIVLGPLCGLVVALFCGMNLLTTFTDVIVPGISGYVQAMFGPILMGCVVAAFYSISGAAQSIADAIYRAFTYKARKKAKDGEDVVLRPIIAILVIYAIGVSLAYGGLNPFVTMFILIPIGLDVFEKARMPREMAPGVVLGALATAACSMPGTTSDQNVIAGTLLGTNAMAAAVPGFIGGALVLVMNIIMMNVIAKHQIVKGNVYTKPENIIERPEEKPMPHWFAAVIPLAVTIIIYNGLKVNVIVALAVNIILSIILFWKYFGGVKGLKKLINPVPAQAAELLLQVGALGALGAVVAASPVFPAITEGLLNMQIPGLFKVIICIALLTGVSGSGPAGLNATLPYLKESFVQMGINMNAVHRVAVFSSQTLDTLPTNPGFAVATNFIGVPMNKSYKYVFITTVLNTTITSFVVAIILTVFPGLA
ncbi:MAG TPA: hypothetical protein IAA08_11265 [Candidatus Eubacterium avistercoris]|uniref:GntP family permease n=1 Tax=Candidatus Eubacterium avistercoris TaxID=2838567 RepID=A0A9D2D4H7_9FIRM|nr:hypothetical protein [Candidatus Eubacterium avistercoris]